MTETTTNTQQQAADTPEQQTPTYFEIELPEPGAYGAIAAQLQIGNNNRLIVKLYDHTGKYLKTLALPKNFPEKNPSREWMSLLVGAAGMAPDEAEQSWRRLAEIYTDPETPIPRAPGKTRKRSEQQTIQTATIETPEYLAEQIHHPIKGDLYAIYDKTKNTITYKEKIERPGQPDAIPITGDEITMDAIILPKKAAPPPPLPNLINAIKTHIHKWCDISPEYETIAAWYVPITWIQDKLNTIAYLRLLGDTGTGKSRTQDVIGGVCYHPFKASGSITPAPIYRILKKWGNITLLIDEADFSDTSEKAEVIKILNCGYERGRPILRADKEHPENIHIMPSYCPKIIATRQRFDDKALESRCLTEIMRQTTRTDIPDQLPPEYYTERDELQSQLLGWRLTNLHKIDTTKALTAELGPIEPRLKQISRSLALLFIDNPEMLNQFRAWLKQYNQELVDDRADTWHGQIVRALLEILIKNEIEPDKITASHIADNLKAKGHERATPTSVGKRLKELGIRSKCKKVAEKTRRVLILEPNMIRTLARRYVTLDDEIYTQVKPGDPGYTWLHLVTLAYGGSAENIIKSMDRSEHAVPIASVTTVTCNRASDPPKSPKEPKTTILQEFQNWLENMGHATLSEAAQYLAQQGLDSETANRILYELHHAGCIYEPRHGQIAWSGSKPITKQNEGQE